MDGYNKKKLANTTLTELWNANSNVVKKLTYSSTSLCRSSMKHVQTHKKSHQIIIEKTSYVFATSSIKNKQNPKKQKHAKVTYNSRIIKIIKYYLKNLLEL